MIVYAFDVDDTLEVSNGPIKLQALMDLRNQGHIVGLCGNWRVFIQSVNGWQHLISFFNYAQVKNVFLWEMKHVIKADDYVMVGNVGPLDSRTYNIPQTGGSDDMSQALAARWRFIKESDFVSGTR
jgi:hypothetical protein